MIDKVVLLDYLPDSRNGPRSVGEGPGARRNSRATIGAGPSTPAARLAATTAARRAIDRCRRTGASKAATLPRRT